MRAMILALVFIAACVLPSQSIISHENVPYEVDDIKTIAQFELRPVSVKQNFTSGTWDVSYTITVKNTGETRLTDVVLKDTLPPDMKYYSSHYENTTDGKLILKSIDVNEDGTTKSVSWFLDKLETGQQKSIKLIVKRHGTDVERDRENVVEARGTVLTINERNMLYATMNNISNISLSCTEEKNNETVIYTITIENSGITRVRNVTLSDLLPQNMIYSDSTVENQQGVEESLPMPSIENNSDGTTRKLEWYFGDFETGTLKQVMLTVEHNGDRYIPKNNMIIVTSQAFIPVIFTEIPMPISVTNITSGSEITNITSGSEITNITSGSEITNITSGSEMTNITSGSEMTNITSGSEITT